MLGASCPPSRHRPPLRSPCSQLLPPVPCAARGARCSASSSARNGASPCSAREADAACVASRRATLGTAQCSPLRSPLRDSLAAMLLASLCAATAVAQHNRVERNNDPWYVRSLQQHPQTTRYLVWPSTAPPSYGAPMQAVAAGTKVWRHVPRAQAARNEPRVIDGLYVGLRLSAAGVPPAPGYRPALRLHKTTTMAGATGVPDLSAGGTLLTIPGASMPFGAEAVVTSVTIDPALPFTTSEPELCLTAEYRGGEHDLLAATAAQPSQCTLSTWMDGSTYALGAGLPIAQSVGFADPLGAITLSTDDRYVLWASWMERHAVIDAHSDWGERRGPPLVPPASGRSIGTGFADLASMAGRAAWSVTDFAHPGAAAVPFLNVGAIVAGGTSLFGQRLEVSLADPALALLASAGYVLTLDAFGVGSGVRVGLPPLGAGALGTSIGVEFVIVDLTTATVRDSTQAYWMTIVR